MESIIGIGLLSLNACISSYTALKLAKQESTFKRLHQFGKQNRMVFRELFYENTERYEFLNKLFSSGENEYVFPSIASQKSNGYLLPKLEII